MSLPITIDADPERDDAVAIILACGARGSGGLDVRMVTTVAGNAPVQRPGGRDNHKRPDGSGPRRARPAIPVVAGAAVGLLYRSLVTVEQVHGESGLAVSEKLRLPNH